MSISGYLKSLKHYLNQEDEKSKPQRLPPFSIVLRHVASALAVTGSELDMNNLRYCRDSMTAEWDLTLNQLLFIYQRLS